MTTQHPEALRLAEELDDGYPLTGDAISAAAELRSQHARITELEAQLASIGAGGVSGPLTGRAFDAADMATASAQGFRDGVASLAASAGSEPVAIYHGRCVIDCGAHGHLDMELLKMIPAGSKLYTHPSPPEGMVGGWISVDERLPAPDEPVLACNGKWIGVAAWMSGDYLEPLERWQDEHREFIEMMGPAVAHWMPLPPPPTSSADSRKG